MEFKCTNRNAVAQNRNQQQLEVGGLACGGRELGNAERLEDDEEVEDAADAFAQVQQDDASANAFGARVRVAIDERRCKEKVQKGDELLIHRFQQHAIGAIQSVLMKQSNKIKYFESNKILVHIDDRQKSLKMFELGTSKTFKSKQSVS
jgi:hypothetical protein